MAGTIIADYIRTDANQLSLNVGNTTFATINAGGFYSNTGVQIISPTGAINAASIAAGSIPVGKLGAASVSRTNMYSGAVLQVVRGEYSTSTSTSSVVTWSNVGSATITPTTTSNKILVTATYHTSGVGSLRLLRNSTALNTPTSTYMTYSNYASNNQGGWNSNSDRQIVVMEYYDSPATTSSTTYNVEMIAYDVTGTDGFGVNEIHGGVTFSGITLMEIAA